MFGTTSSLTLNWCSPALPPHWEAHSNIHTLESNADIQMDCEMQMLFLWTALFSLGCAFVYVSQCGRRSALAKGKESPYPPNRNSEAIMVSISCSYSQNDNIHSKNQSLWTFRTAPIPAAHSLPVAASDAHSQLFVRLLIVKLIGTLTPKGWWVCAGEAWSAVT